MNPTDFKHFAVKAFGVDERHASSFTPWLKGAAHQLDNTPGVVRVLVTEADGSLAAGRALGEFTPSHLVFIEIESPKVNLTKAWTAWEAALAQGMAALGHEVKTYVDHTFTELYPQNRQGKLLSEPSPRTAFVILQEVKPEVEAEYNHWFDVDDGSAGPGGAPISHLAERVSYPGFLRGTRFKVAANHDQPAKHTLINPNYLTVYELTHADALQSEAYTATMKNAGMGAKGSAGRLFRLVVRHAFLEA